MPTDPEKVCLWGRPEVVCARSKRRFDPDLTSNGCRRPAIESAFRRAMAGTHWVASFASWRNTFRISPFELPTEEIIQCQCLLLQELGDSASLTTDRRASKSQAAPTRLTS